MLSKRILLGAAGRTRAGGLDADTALLLHMDGEDDGIIFPDSSITSPKGNATVNGDVVTKTAWKKWGTASGLFTGASGYLSYTDNSAWDIIGSNSDNQSIDMWVKWSATPLGYQYFIGQHEATWENQWCFGVTNSQALIFNAYKDGAGILNFQSAAHLITDTDPHWVALCKVGNKYGIYLEGTQVAYREDDSTDTLSALLTIGQKGGGEGFLGYIDELRWQKSNLIGAAPNEGLTDTIKVPTSPYS